MSELSLKEKTTKGLFWGRIPQAYAQGVHTADDTGFHFLITIRRKAVLHWRNFSSSCLQDFYDSMFLLALTEPDYDFLKARCGIGTLVELKSHINELLQAIGQKVMARYFELLLFNSRNTNKFLRFGEYLI